MRYKNKRTGAIIDSPFKVLGKDWELVEPKIVEEIETEEVEAEKLEETTEEDFVEEEVNLNDLTNDQLEKLAEEQNIKLTTADKKNKDTRIAAIVAGLE